eukprot:1177017-Prorocentrum_minimum.AAC.5
MTTSHSTRERVAPAVRHRWRPRHAPRRCAAIRRPPPTKPQPAIGHRRRATAANRSSEMSAWASTRCCV